MKHGTEPDIPASAPVDSDRLKALRCAVAGACGLTAGALSWVMLFGALAGNWWAIGGIVYALTLSVTLGLLLDWARTPERPSLIIDSHTGVYTADDAARDREAVLAMDLIDPTVSGTTSEREGA